MPMKTVQYGSSIFHVSNVKKTKVDTKNGTKYRISFQVGIMTGNVDEDMVWRPASFFVGEKKTAKDMVELLEQAVTIFMVYKEYHQLAEKDETSPVFYNVKEFSIMRWKEDAKKGKKGKGKKGKKNS